ncbi:nodulation S family protein [Actinomycetospora endophytica]|uniref:Nodulation S family protein n=1 Tax=Actinomycetospora endophytica TaxID=2291215 RepID=A0ABS8PH72_9PSEU|nr:SAM-dependent methyltransferase [Actinomycetospora endophytica]MCD2197627.1 nodulation S family protein [Actinomycetospora endophytica]
MTPDPAISLGPEHFDRLWASEDDPWGLESSWYEDRKRAVVLGALPEPRYRRGLEPGCAGGALSELLAARCAELHCLDIAEPALARARARLAGRQHVRVTRGGVPDDLPDGLFDLVVVSEIAYYLGTPDRGRLWRNLVAALEPGGTLLAVHWLREAPEYPVTGDRVHDELADVDGLERLVEHREADFRLDVLVRVPPPARSVALRAGVR